MIRLDLQRIGAACAIAYALLLVAALAGLTSIGFAAANGADEFLPVLAAHQTVAGAVSIMFIIMPLLEVAVGMGFFRMLYRGESIAWLVLFGFVGGGLSLVCRGFTWLAMTLQLAPAYVQADAAGKSSLAAVGDTLRAFAMSADMVGAVLVGGIGVLLVSVLMHRYGVGPRWLAWLGIFAALAGGWLELLTEVSDVAAAINAVGSLGYIVWMVIAGLVAWRTPASVAEKSDHGSSQRRQPEPNLEAAVG